MELKDFLVETQNDVRAQLDDGQPIAETAFTEIVMQHMADIGMTYEPQPGGNRLTVVIGNPPATA